MTPPSRDARLATMRCCAALVVGLGLLAPGCGGPVNKATGTPEVKPAVLTLANWEGAEEDVGDWTRAVGRLSHGSVRIAARGEWRRDEPRSERATLDDVRAGRVDLAHIPARAWDTLGVPTFRAMQAPMLVDSLAWEERILRSDAGARMLASLRTAGVEPI